MASWVDDGMLVDVPVRLIASETFHRRRRAVARLGGSPMQSLRCVVVCAMGDTARVMNDIYSIDTWVQVEFITVVNPERSTNEV